MLLREGLYYGLRCKYQTRNSISKTSIHIKEADIVDNAYERLLEYEGHGSLIIKRFNELPKEIHEGHARTILRTIKRHNLLDEVHPMAPFIKEKFPELWEQAKKEQTS